jgi:hypothetical protein
MNTDKEKSVQGVAIYAEFARNGATTQIIVTPDGHNSDGNVVPATIVRRTVTEHTPKKQWRFSRLANSDADLEALVSSGSEHKEKYADERLRYASNLFHQVLVGDWTIVKKPILLEVSKIDLDSIALSKTPTKMIYRINQSRSALDFPADLVNSY